MSKGNHNYYETQKYRCLVEYDAFQRQIGSQQLYFTMCGIERCTPDKCFGPRARSGYHLHAVLAGRGYLKVNDKEIEIHAGQMFIEKPGEITYYHPDRKDPWTYCWITFDGAAAASFVSNIGFVNNCHSLTSYIDVNEYYKLVDRMLSKPELTESSLLQRYGLMMQFLGLAVESGRKASGLDPGGMVGQTHYIDYAINYIQNNYSEIKVADISAYLGIDRSYFAGLFRQRVGIPPQEYLQTVRLSKSIQLLRHTELSVQEIATYVGYASSLNFSKAFKKALGVSPSRFREMPDEQCPKLKNQLPEDNMT